MHTFGSWWLQLPSRRRCWFASCFKRSTGVGSCVILKCTAAGALRSKYSRSRSERSKRFLDSSGPARDFADGCTGRCTKAAALLRSAKFVHVCCIAPRLAWPSIHRAVFDPLRPNRDRPLQKYQRFQSSMVLLNPLLAVILWFAVFSVRSPPCDAVKGMCTIRSLCNVDRRTFTCVTALRALHSFCFHCVTVFATAIFAYTFAGEFAPPLGASLFDNTREPPRGR